MWRWTDQHLKFSFGKENQVRANQEIMKGCVHLKLNGIFFVREFPFYFNLHFKLHYDIKVNADPSIFTSPCLCKKTKPKHTVFCCMYSHGILRAGRIILVHPIQAIKFCSLHQSNDFSPLFPLLGLVCPRHKSWEGSQSEDFRWVWGRGCIEAGKFPTGCHRGPEAAQCPQGGKKVHGNYISLIYF